MVDVNQQWDRTTALRMGRALELGWRGSRNHWMPTIWTAMPPWPRSWSPGR